MDPVSKVEVEMWKLEVMQWVCSDEMLNAGSAYLRQHGPKPGQPGHSELRGLGGLFVAEMRARSGPINGAMLETHELPDGEAAIAAVQKVLADARHAGVEAAKVAILRLGHIPP